MASEKNEFLDLLVQQRIAANAEQIRNSLKQIAAGNPLGAETQPERAVDRLQAKSNLPRQQVEMMAANISETARAIESGGGAEMMAKGPAPEAIWGSTLDFVGVAFLQRGRQVADAVGRVAFLDGRPNGTGFMVGPNLFLTNHHVLESPAESAHFCVEFDYEVAPGGATLAVSRFAFDSALCFVTDDTSGLDFTLIGVGRKLSGPKDLDRFGFIPLSNAADKHMLGEVANIIQHPQGRLKEVVLRENQLVARDETRKVLHYIADTEPGASGSPVFNNQWEAIALHHWGGPWIEGRNSVGSRREINEGIRISAVVNFIKAALPNFSGSTLAKARDLLDLWDRSGRRGESHRQPSSSLVPEPDQEPASNPRISEDGRVTWTIPLELSLRLPGYASTAQPKTAITPAKSDPITEVVVSEAKRKKEDFSDRSGYEPGFIPGFIVPLPKLAAHHSPARNLQAAAGDDPFELRYHHFSIKINAARRLAYFTACNIDGAAIKSVNRDDKTVTDNPSLKDLGVESLGAEGSDAFRPDDRISLDEQMTKPFYEEQRVPGFPDPKSKDRIARMFQKGHIILRGDPAWGIESMALAAERDTFFYTNAAPQVGFFNQGSQLNRPGSKGKLRWRAVETYVLRNAVTMRQRITVFAGPVFADTDPDYRFDSKVPMHFWKIAVWAENDGLRSIALLADQSEVLKVMPEGLPSTEAFQDPDEIARVAEFLTTITDIEALTGLDFGVAVREADVRAGEAQKNVIDGATPALLKPARKPKPRKRTAKQKTR